MSLKEILSKVEACRDVINQDLSEVDLRARTYKTGQINSAKSRLEGLENDYKNELQRNSVTILVTGKRSEAFAKIAEEKFNCFTINGKSFYQDAVDKLSTQLYLNKSIGSSVFDVLGNIIEERMRELDINEYNSLIFEAKYSRVIKDKEEMLDIATLAVNDTIGPEIVGLDALDKISKKAIEAGYGSRTVPVVIFSEDESFIDKIGFATSKLSPRMVTVSAGAVKTAESFITLKTVSEDSVGKALKQIASNA